VVKRPHESAEKAAATAPGSACGSFHRELAFQGARDGPWARLRALSTRIPDVDGRHESIPSPAGP
jgi:hypothetical protein